jgi:signal transduction histidine kinase
LHLAANYLRAPITLLIGSSEALAETVKDDIIVNLQAVTMSLQSKVAHIMQQVEHSQGLSASAPLAKTVDETPLIRSSHFWIPIMVGAILALVTDFVMARLGDLDNSLVTYAIQTVIFVVLACLFYLVLSLVYRSSQQRSSKKALINQQENELKTARHTLMSEAATTLDEDLISLEKILPMLPQDATELQLLAEGTRRLRQIITTFKLLLQVENLPVDASGSETFDAVGLNNIISKAVHQSSTQIAAKELTLIQPSPNMISVPGSPELLQYVVSSILANATSFSPQHATVSDIERSRNPPDDTRPG